MKEINIMTVEQAVNNEVNTLSPKHQQLIKEARVYPTRGELRSGNINLYQNVQRLGLLDLVYYYSSAAHARGVTRFDKVKAYLQIRRPDYYEYLLQNAQIIIDESKIQTQADLGQDLGLNQSQMSTVLKLLKGYLNVHANNS